MKTVTGTHSFRSADVDSSMEIRATVRSTQRCVLGKDFPRNKMAADVRLAMLTLRERSLQTVTVLVQDIPVEITATD